ncbi:hypothetical protein GGI12_005354 [Dipsacomyces acuminosporus]|nr:hypothetical protein GGI12_005354 [Dipsacomyces acuminosporus]
MIYSADVAGLKQWRFPLWANRLAGRWVLPLLSPSNAPTGPRSRETIPGISTGLNGAGFAQMVARNAGLQVNGNGNGAAQRRRANGRNTPNQGQQQQQQGVRRADTSASLGSYLSELGPGDIPQASEEQISLLQSMFPDVSRDQVVQALQLSNNDPNRAVTLLLDSTN